MTKKSQAAAAAATDQSDAQTSALATEEAAAEQPTEEAATEQPTVEGADDPAAENAAGAEQEPVRGRALVDLPAYDLKCGEFGSLPYETARALWASGYFDPRAVEQEG